jgi:predicted peptidase
MLRTLFLLFVFMISLAPMLVADDAEQTAKKLETTVRVEMSYLLSLPKDYDQKESWPLLVFLHGSGERGDDLELVKTHGPPKLIAQGKEFPFIVVSPQCP